MASVEVERQELIKAYPSRATKGSTWANRVNNMPESQVHAIYLRLKNQGKIKN